MSVFLGVDGGGTKTDFVVLRADGEVLAVHREGPAYHLEIGLDGLRAMIGRGVGAALSKAGIGADAVAHAFIGLPAYGEDDSAQGALDDVGADVLPRALTRCGNDMLCAWAGALACGDGINIVAGTGSIAYGEHDGRAARAGGWGELFGDEGSAYWTAREGLALFSRMADGRAGRGPLYDLLRRHFALDDDLQICAAVYGSGSVARSGLAQISRLVAQAAESGDAQAAGIFERGGQELAAIAGAARRALQIPPGRSVAVSYTGGMFTLGRVLLDPLRTALAAREERFELRAPQLPSSAGAALYAARCGGTTLTPEAIGRLARRLPPAPV